MDPRTKRVDAEGAARLASRIGRHIKRYRDVPWPGGTLLVRLVAPTTEDKQLAEAAALERLRKTGIPVTAITADTLSEERTLQVLAAAIHDPERPLPGVAGELGMCEPLSTADELRATLDTFEREAFVDELNDLIETVAPELNTLSAEERLLVEEALKKKDSRSLRNCGSRTLSAYLLSTADPP